MSKTRNLANSAPQFNALIVPTGTTAQRPAVVPGYIRFNTTLNVLESANNTAWANVGSGAASSSGGGGVTWQPVQNTNFIAVVDSGYAVNTARGNVIVTLPASPTIGSVISLVDYARTFSANGMVLYPNGNKIQGNTANVLINSSGSGTSLVYIDSIQGWISYAMPSSIGPYSIQYFVIAGGGSGGGDTGQNVGSGGGGAGGLIQGVTTVTPGIGYSLVIGAGGSGSTNSGAAGSNSTGLGLTAIGGGYGGGTTTTTSSFAATSGGSGGGGYGWGGNSTSLSGGSGTAGQGYAGGTGVSPSGYGAGGGGGAGGVGANGSTTAGGNGGTGVLFSLNGSYYAGGGGGGVLNGTAGSGGSGGGGNGSPGNADISNGTAGTSNTGGGGGGASSNADGPSAGGSGGSGIILIAYSGPQKGSGGTITSAGGYTIHTFTSSGNFIA